MSEKSKLKVGQVRRDPAGRQWEVTAVEKRSVWIKRLGGAANSNPKPRPRGDVRDWPLVTT